MKEKTIKQHYYNLLKVKNQNKIANNLIQPTGYAARLICNVKPFNWKETHYQT
jgi:hypothetical protein